MAILGKIRLTCLLSLAAMVGFGSFTVETASAQESFGTVVGLVTAEDTGQPLANTNVFIVGTGLGALSNQSGNFIIQRVPPGTYELEFSSIGRSTLTVEFTLAAGENQVVNGAMELAPRKGMCKRIVDLVSTLLFIRKSMENQPTLLHVLTG